MKSRKATKERLMKRMRQLRKSPERSTAYAERSTAQKYQAAAQGNGRQFEMCQLKTNDRSTAQYIRSTAYS